MACECSLTLGDDVIDVGDLAFITAVADHCALPTFSAAYVRGPLLLKHYALKLGGENVSAIREIYAWITTKSKDFSFWSNLASLNALIFPILEHSVLLCISGRKPLLTFSSSKRWNRRTWIAWTIWKWKKRKQLANVWRLLRVFFVHTFWDMLCVCVSIIYSIFECNKY